LLHDSQSCETEKYGGTVNEEWLLEATSKQRLVKTQQNEKTLCLL
jgi:hypothetical protein